MGDESTVAAETATLDPLGVCTKDEGPYLLVVELGSSSIARLPDPGIVTIGRAPEVELRVDHSSVSRQHARIVIDRGEMRISDLDSHNGTRVNGAPLVGGRVLKTGDVVAIGEVILIVHGQPRRATGQAVLDEPAFRQRLAAEVERAVAFRRPLSVLAILGHEAPVTGLRVIDVLGVDDGVMIALLPEAEPATATRLALQISARAPSTIRIGLASCPDDATDADSLVLAAHAAARAASENRIGRVADTLERRRFDDREVLICHPAMVRVYDLLQRLAPSELPVLILGETGVGKEDAARAVHVGSPRKTAPLVAVNCGALPESLVESELFGHAKGAFTGATSARAGVFEAASGGTLFLDEIGELPLSIQAKLLRALETRRIVRVGETHERAVDIRLIAATHNALEAAVEDGRFRRDLYYRLGVARVYLPPLRDRRCDIPVLFREFVARAALRVGRQPPTVVAEVMQRLLTHGWPGNVRELKHVAELVVATVEDDRIEPSDLPAALGDVPSRPEPPERVEHAGPLRRLADELEELERLRMTEALARTGGVKTRAAAALGMPIRTFNMKLRQYGL